MEQTRGIAIKILQSKKGTFTCGTFIYYFVDFKPFILNYN
jgi:hypothetical protein